MKVMYEGLLVGEIVTNRSLTVDEAIELVDVDAFCERHQLDKEELDPNVFELVY